MDDKTRLILSLGIYPKLIKIVKPLLIPYSLDVYYPLGIFSLNYRYPNGAPYVLYKASDGTSWSFRLENLIDGISEGIITIL